jgi:23S rRNA (cytosine1962-C5)-methyltransferase
VTAIGRGLGAADVARHATMLENRVRKNLRRLRGRFEREGIGVFRVYDWDIPEVRVVVDWYEGHLVVSEYEREQTRALEDYVGTMGVAAAEGAGVSPAQVHARRRRTRPAGGEARYGRQGQAGERMAVREGDLRFWVNLTDYLDTGLFAHHRITRARVRAESGGADVLNLFGYTGAFTVAAAAGGAQRSVTVDASGRYLEWAQDNLALNGIAGEAHRVVKADVREALGKMAREARRYSLVVVDPPSFSDRGGDWDVQRDHAGLLRDVLGVTARGGVVWFSTNHARFEPKLDGLPVAELVELTEETTPEDFRRAPHRVWRMVAA